jgi:hypothetical protein
MKTSKKESIAIQSREKIVTSRNTNLGKGDLTQWKRKESGFADPKINEGLRKIFVNSILWNFE